MDFLSQVIKDSKNEYAGFVSEGVSAGDVSGFIDTGSYLFNAVVSGSIYGGIPSNKITGLAGPSGTGKTFYALSVVRHFLNTDPEAGVIYFESESAISRDMIEDRGIDSRRMIIFPVATVEEFRTEACRIMDKYLDVPEDERKPMMFVLDSLGQLSTNKEMTDMVAGAEKRDMTRSQLIKGAFRVLTLKCGKANVPLIFTNHVYATMGTMYPEDKMGGGSGPEYSASTLIFLGKRKEKDGTDQVGNIIRCKAKKSRLTRENSQVETRLFFDNRGLDKYFGLEDYAVKAGVWSKSGTRYEIDGKKYYGKTILQEPEQFFTPEVLDAIDEVVKKEMKYGTGEETTEEELDGED